MTKENLLQKVRRSLTHPKVTLFRARERDSYIQGAADYGYSFEIVPKKGIYQIDAKTKDSLITLRNIVFKELLSKEYEDRREDFEGIPYVGWGVIPPYDPNHWNSEILPVVGLRIHEPVGIREEREDEYCTHSCFYILPKFTSEFSSAENRGENQVQHKATLKRTPITRLIDVSLFPSFEYLQRLSEIHRERDALYSLRMGSDSIEGHDRLKEMERKIGFVDINSIHIPAYNSFFSDKVNGDPVKV